MKNRKNIIEHDKIIETEDIELDLFVEAMFKKYGYDFRNYSKAHMKRRVLHRMGKDNVESISILQHKVLHDAEYFFSILSDFSINVTEMFRDPEVFKYMRKEVVPLLKSYPKLKIWHAGCSSGQEVYSMAIMLKEEGLLERSTIYATDFNDDILAKAKEGIYPIELIKEYTKNYIEAGGINDFADYYTAKYDSVILNQEIKKKIVFANHNLVTDSDFGSMHMIICRNVLIYFDRELQNKVIHMFTRSLENNGILALGSKETIEYTADIDYYKPWNKEYRIYQKKVIRQII